MEDLFSELDSRDQVDRSDILLIRCSQLGLLMTEPKEKAKKESGELGETAKKLIHSIWLFNKYGYKENVVTDGMMKGLLCEQDSMALLQSVLGGEFRKKNEEIKQNDYIIGCCDIPLKKEDVIEDNKASQNLRTFFEAKYKVGDRYWWQGQGYMWLWGKRNYRLIYTLVPTPEEYIKSAKNKFFYKFNQDSSNEDYIEISMQIEKNNAIISEIPEKDRVKVFEFTYDADAIERVKVQHDKAVKYYNTLSL